VPTAAEWLPDPSGAHEFRYWDGAQWTDYVSDGGLRGRAPYEEPEPPSPPPSTRPPAPPVVTRDAAAVNSSSTSASTDASVVPDEHRLDLSSGWAVVLGFLLATAGGVAAAMAWIVKVKADRWAETIGGPRPVFNARVLALLAAEDRKNVAYWILAGVFVAFALAAILFSYWAARRAEAFTRAKFRAEWQLWGWLIPVANFILIPELQTDLWDSYASKEHLQRREANKPQRAAGGLPVESGRRTPPAGKPLPQAAPAGARLLVAAWAMLILAGYLFTKTVTTDPAGSKAFPADWRNHYLHAAWAPTVLALALLFFAGHFLTLKLRIAKRLEELRTPGLE
jgi:hypothetical protein